MALPEPGETLGEEANQDPYLGRTGQPCRIDRPHIRLLGVVREHLHKLASRETLRHVSE